jgi:hypothetical protein
MPEQPASATARSNRFFVWPLLVGLVVPVFVSCAMAVALGLIFALLPLLIIWVLSGIGALIAVGIYTRRSEWRSAISLAVLPAIVALTILFPRTVVSPFLKAGDFLRFWVKRSSYIAKVAALPRDHGPRFEVFPLEGHALGPDEEIVYDESDEIALPPEQQTRFIGCWYEQFRLEGHFYKVIVDCRS